MTNKSHKMTFTVVLSIIEDFISRAQQTIAANQKVKVNFLPFMVNNNEQTIKTLVDKIIFKPKEVKVKQDSEAVPLGQDNMMNVGEPQNDQKKIIVNRKAEEKEKKSTGRTHKSKAIMKTEVVKSQKIPYMSTMRKLSMKEPPLRNDDQNLQQFHYITRLRQHKERELIESTRNSASLNLKPKIKNRPLKGQKIVFDYQGGFQKGKQGVSSHFDQHILESAIEKTVKLNKKIQNIERQNQNVTILSKNLERSIRNKSQKAGLQPTSQGIKRENMISQIKLSDSKTKMIFDGQTILKMEQRTDNKSEIIMRERSQTKDGLSKKLALQQLTISRKVSQIYEPQKGILIRNSSKPQKQQKSRLNTELSDSRSWRQRINVQSETLKRVLVTEGDQPPLQIPKNRIKRILTTNEYESTHQDKDLEKIREKLNIKKQKLPQILGRLASLETQLMRSIRKKIKA